MRRFVLTSFVAISLSGCGNLVTSTLIDIGALDPFTADPAGFAVGLETESGLGFVEDGVVWTLAAVHSPSGDERTIAMVLEENRRADGLVVFRPSAADVEALRGWQRDLEPWKETSDGNSSLYINVTAKPCRIPGAMIPEDPSVSIFVQLAQDAPMRPLVRNAEILDHFEIESLEAVDLCSDGPY